MEAGRSGCPNTWQKGFDLKKLNIMVVGAHPDDCEGGCGGTAIKYVREGCHVTFVSVTDGSAGHQTMDRKTLAEVRRKEAAESARIAGVESIVLSHPDGLLEAGLKEREEMVRLIRKIRPDVIFTHRLNDYHPDHRNTSQLVEDSSYLVMVPAICPDTPALDYQPAIFFVYDSFQRPYPFSPDIAVAIDDALAEKVRMTACHRSQYLEFLPWMARKQGEIDDAYEISRYPYDSIEKWDARVAMACREKLQERYGKDKSVRHAEAYEISEYGREIPQDELGEYFPY